jgi:hypothetical protein
MDRVLGIGLGIGSLELKSWATSDLTSLNSAWQIHTPELQDAKYH